ncbi:uncharacterized protein LOC132197527 [Neocloeon triangulifer]|uniref:uncharacterized protein LOC132197527 n=1 Tax=Neocloeon triangulifer TaxID=2078957 RepID=UPI00286F6AAD|nr:uncharacterized protein LOC132197527 [Neocloeon triangulifer]
MKVAHPSLALGLLFFAAATQALVLLQDVCPDVDYKLASEIIMLWDAKNCSKFYKCSYGGNMNKLRPYEFSCPKGLTFDPKEGVCGWRVDFNPKPCHPLYYQLSRNVVY